MKTLCVLQHTEAEFLGLMEDHFEGRSIRFQYVRPFTPGAAVPADARGFDGLVVLGAGPLGIVSGHLVPSLAPESRLLRDFLSRKLPVLGIGFGACLLAAAAGGGAAEAPLCFSVGRANRVEARALAGHLPESYPLVVYMRDRPILAPSARVLAVNQANQPALFQIGDNCFGFLGHPGTKSAMIEDLIMEFDEAPEATAENLADLRMAQGEIAAALGQIMVGLIKATGLMVRA
jgi:GMP synthase-like glutamine amidotransferase